MNISEIQYVADSQGQTTGVLIPFPLWREIQEKLAVTHDPIVAVYGGNTTYAATTSSPRSR